MKKEEERARELRESARDEEVLAAPSVSFQEAQTDAVTLLSEEIQCALEEAAHSEAAEAQQRRPKISIDREILQWKPRSPDNHAQETRPAARPVSQPVQTEAQRQSFLKMHGAVLEPLPPRKPPQKTR